MKRRGMRRTLLFVAIPFALAASLYLLIGIWLSDAEINGLVGINTILSMKLTHRQVDEYRAQPPKFLQRNGAADEELASQWEALGVTRIGWDCGCSGMAVRNGRAYGFFAGAFTSDYVRIVFTQPTREQVKTMVFEDIERLCTDRYGCDGGVSLSDSFDGLNVTADERSDLALVLEELYGVEIPDDVLESFVTVEDMVGYIEDRL